MNYPKPWQDGLKAFMKVAFVGMYLVYMFRELNFWVSVFTCVLIVLHLRYLRRIAQEESSNARRAVCPGVEPI